MYFPADNAHADAARDATRDSPIERPALVVFTSQRWCLGGRRPQHLLTRIAKHYRVIVVETPVTTHAEAWLERSEPAPGIERLVPHTHLDVAEAPGFHPRQHELLLALLIEFLFEHGIAQPVVWLEAPQALPLAQALAPRCLMVDVLDEAMNRAADDAGATNDAELMRLADVVIAGGPSLYQSHRGRHANVHCIANAVDPEHFAPAALGGTSIEAVSARSIHAAIPSPRLGWFGPIDECVDLDLVARVADLRPDWQLVMAGALVGVARADLPQRPNIHWIGPQTYAILPHLQAHWDVCILPLKCHDAARHASPEQALAYLAGQKSVVSTPVHDIVALYGHIVRLAHDANAFVEACRAALTERGPLRRQRRIDALIAVHSCTWDRAADRVHKLLVESAREGTTAPRVAQAAATPAPTTTPAVPDELLAANAMRFATPARRHAIS